MSLVRIHPISWSLLPILLFWATTAFTRSTPAILSGTITNIQTNIPLVGAKIQVNNQITWSVSGGYYTLSVDPVGTFPVMCTKPGFESYSSQPVTFQSGVPVVMDIAMNENTNPPGPVIAVLDTALQTVHLNWQVPVGQYAVNYDDGIADNFTVWAQQGNINAVRFTPLAWPINVKGGMIHIGNPSNYPPGSNPLVPFQVAVYNASGPGGMPGTIIAGPFDVIPASFGWIEFNFPTTVTIPAGSFYLAMIQGGNSPNACGLAVDETTPAFRSASRFFTGGGPWIPASGNFMIRVVVEGSGGPATDLLVPGSLQNYEVWRLRQGEEQNPTIWTNLGATPDPFLNDPGWFGFPCGPYRYAVKAKYSGNRLSASTFSNILGKCWTAQVTVNTNLSCEAGNRSGAAVTLKNVVYPDTLYSALTDTTGVLLFPNVWKGIYELRINRFGYNELVLNTPVGHDTVIQATLLQIKSPPRDVNVNEKTLVVHWQPPLYEEDVMQEDWSSGDFTTGNWSVDGGFNWAISSSNGNPAPSAMFFWSPHATSYSQSLVSRDLQSDYAPVLELSYDIFFDNFGTTTLNQFAVEIWDGTSWTLLKNYTNSAGSFPWTTENIDISSWSDDNFRVRFRAYGEDTYDIDSWNIDNIRIHAAESQMGMSACVIGYNVYLDMVLTGFTPDTKFTLPPNLVNYGEDYQACVNAVFASGQSEKDCESFTSTFLYPPTDFAAEIIENTVELRWNKPQVPDTGNQTITPPGLKGYAIYRNDLLIKTINDPDSVKWYDMGLEPGTYSYSVTALYDLAFYGYPGQTDESLAAGPITLEVNFGRQLPFYESWDQGTFSYNNWTFVPTQGNWQVSTFSGNPLPCSQFSWEPILAEYSNSLETPALDATPVTCGSVKLDFDIALESMSNTGQERLMIEVYLENSWHTIQTFANDSSFGWTSQSIDISEVAGHGFLLRFTAKGINSADIVRWSIDNIAVYAVCKAPDTLVADVWGYDVHLWWTPPDCSGGSMSLNEDFEGDDFPPAGWDQVVTNSASTWSHTGKNSPVGVYAGNYSAGLIWDYVHQDEWLIAEDIEVTGDLEFWSYAYQGSVHGDHYYVKISLDNGNSWTPIFDLSALPPYPGPGGYNQWMTPYTIDLSAYQGQVASFAWHAIDGDGQGLWYSWAIDNCSVGGKSLKISDPSDELLGYHVYRKGPADPGFVKITVNAVSDTTYFDSGLPPGFYQYFVLPLFSECTYSDTSIIASVDVVTSILFTDPDIVKVYPNPAEDLLFAEVPDDAGEVVYLLSNMEGKVIFYEKISGHSPHKLSVANLPPGLYFLRINAASFTSVRKILVH